MIEPLPYGIKITIEGHAGHGKTLAALTIRDALKALGAWVGVVDGDEAHHADTKMTSHDTPRRAEEPLSQTSVVIRTKYPE